MRVTFFNLRRGFNKVTHVALVAGQIAMLSSSPAFAKGKAIPIGTDRISSLLQSCLLQGGGDHPNTRNLPVYCCATNAEGTQWCVSCEAGTEQNPRECSVGPKAHTSLRNRLQSVSNNGPTVAKPAGTDVRRSKPRGTSPAIIAPNN